MGELRLELRLEARLGELRGGEEVCKGGDG